MLGGGLFAQESKLAVDPVLFSVMAAINAAGYDAELASLSNSPVRKQIADYVAAKKPASLAALKEFYLAHKKPDATRDLSQYISYALCLEIVESPNGPDFRYRLRTNELPPDVQELEGFDRLMTRFYRETNLAGLIANNQKSLDGVLETYGAPVTLAMQEIDGYLRIPRVNSTKGIFHIYLDLLAAPNQIHVRSYANDLFVVITPSAEPQLDYIRNAYLHFQIDPIAMRSLKDIEAKASLIDFAQGAPALDAQYKNDFALLTVASLVQAVKARMGAGRGRAAAIDESTKEGFILAPYFSEVLADYEKQEQSFFFYLPVMIKGVDLRKETTRLDGVQFASAPKERKAKVGPRPVEEASPAEKSLAEAETVYAKKDYAKAGEIFRRALTETSARALKARAYYGLARIAALSKEPQLAVDLFEKTIAEGAEPQISAWANVYLGRLYELANEGEKAKGHFEAALGTQGASPASRKAAEDGLKGVRPGAPAAKP